LCHLRSQLIGSRRSDDFPPQSEERLPFYALLQSAAYFVKNGILLSVDLSAGLVVGAPGVFAFGFQRSHGTLPLQFLKEGDYPHS
jgi:hypothetical protein